MSIVQSLHCCHYYRYRVNACIANQFKRAMWDPWKIHQSTNSCESTGRWERRWQVFRRDMLGNCLALMVKWSIEAAGPIYHADTMHGRQGRPQQPAHNDNTHIQLHTRAKILKISPCSFISRQFPKTRCPFCCPHPVLVVVGGKHGCGKVLRKSRKSKWQETLHRETGRGERSRWKVYMCLNINWNKLDN